MSQYIVSYHFGGEVLVEAASKEQAKRLVQDALADRRITIDTESFGSVHVKPLDDMPVLDVDS